MAEKRSADCMSCTEIRLGNKSSWHVSEASRRIKLAQRHILQFLQHIADEDRWLQGLRLRQIIETPEVDSPLQRVLFDKECSCLKAKHTMQLDFLEKTYEAAVKEVKDLHFKEMRMHLQRVC
jgi:hypothetical protein